MVDLALKNQTVVKPYYADLLSDLYAPGKIDLVKLLSTCLLLGVIVAPLETTTISTLPFNFSCWVISHT